MKEINSENVNPEMETIKDLDWDIIVDALTGIDAVLIALQSLKAKAIMSTFHSAIDSTGEEQRRINRVQYNFLKQLEDRIQLNNKKKKTK